VQVAAIEKTLDVLIVVHGNRRRRANDNPNCLTREPRDVGRGHDQSSLDAMMRLPYKAMLGDV